MIQIPNLKFDKNMAFLNDQLEVQKVNKNNISNILSNITFISESYKCDQYYLDYLQKGGSDLLNSLNENIDSIEELIKFLSSIIKTLDEIHSLDENTNQKEYIDIFKKVESDVSNYSTTFNELVEKIDEDNTSYSTYIASCNLDSSIDVIASNNPNDILKVMQDTLIKKDDNTENATPANINDFDNIDDIAENENETESNDENNVYTSNDLLSDILDSIDVSDIEDNPNTTAEDSSDITSSDDSVIDNIDITINDIDNFLTTEEKNNSDSDTTNTGLDLNPLVEEKVEEKPTENASTNDTPVHTPDIAQIKEANTVKEVDKNNIYKIIQSNPNFSDTNNIMDLMNEYEDYSTPLSRINNRLDMYEKLEKEADSVIEGKPFDSTMVIDTIEDIDDNQAENVNDNTKKVKATKVSDETIQVNITSENMDWVPKKKIQTSTSLPGDKIDRIIKAEADNETLIISEKHNKIYLPYKVSEIRKYLKSYPDSYKDASDVVSQEFILDLSNFMKHPSKSRFQETYTLMRDRERNSVASSLLYSLKLTNKAELSPAVIAACKNKRDLDIYLNCLDKNRLSDFKAFNIIYEVNPLVT